MQKFIEMRQERRYAVDDDHQSTNFLWRNWYFFTSFLGMVCAVGIWVMAMTVVDSHRGIGIYLIFCGVIFTFLEISFILEKLFGCCSEESLAHQCWLLILAIDNWKRGLLYLALSAACYIINPKEAWQTVVAGAIMDLCGLLYFIKTIKAKKRTEPYKYKQLSVT